MERLLWLCLMLPVIAGASAAPVSEVRLGTNVSPSPTLPGETKSGSVAHVECIFDRLNIPYRIQNMPWRRARQEVYAGSLDGFFTAMMRERATDARLSAPLVLENWYWFWRKDEAPPGDEYFRGRVGAILGSHQSAWFEHVDYPIAQRVNTLDQLLKLVLSGRLDAFIADYDQFEEALKKVGADEEQFDSQFFRYMPLGVYFGRLFLDAHPSFMAEFNRHVYSCAPEGFSLSDEERSTIADLVTLRLRRWSRLSEVQAALEKHNRLSRELGTEDIRTRERQWQHAFLRQEYDVVDRWLDNELSDTFAKWVSDSEGIIVQVLLMDARGFTVAASPLPANYWQGNEAKHERVISSIPGQPVFDVVRFYRSTESFRAHVGVPVVHPGTREPVGVLSIGVNVEAALFTDWPHR
jgi:hypothetical protein